MSRNNPSLVTMDLCFRLFLMLLAPWGFLQVTADAAGFQGHVIFRGTFEDEASYPDLDESSDSTAFNQSGELRLRRTWTMGRTQELEMHYEAVWIRRENNGHFPGTYSGDLSYGTPADTRRAVDLTSVFLERGKTLSYHRIDRLVWRFRDDWGSLTIGRDAITWGNGLVFNPMDLFNPFSPTDVERDYKLGDDLVLLSLYGADWNANTDWQVLLVPRRYPISGKLESQSSSMAVKAHLNSGSAEWDILAAVHYGEPVIGMGRTGYLGGAVWRMDATVTFAKTGQTWFSAIANMDYSWVSGGMNWYGSLEFHYNNLGVGDYDGLPAEEALLDRLGRGETFVVGRAYAAPSLQVELHPLLNLYSTAIVNLEDPSGILLPRLVWSAGQNLEITGGASLPMGASGSEFGGLPIPGSVRYLPSPNRYYIWVKGWF